MIHDFIVSILLLFDDHFIINRGFIFTHNMVHNHLFGISPKYFDIIMLKYHLGFTIYEHTAQYNKNKRQDS